MKKIIKAWLHRRLLLKELKILCKAYEQENKAELDIALSNRIVELIAKLRMEEHKLDFLKY